MRVDTLKQGCFSVPVGSPSNGEYMSSQKIFISSKSYLKYSNNHIVIINDSQTSICLDNIDIVIIENTQTTITTSLLAHLAKKNIITIFSDEKFIPCAINTGMYLHSKSSDVQRHQIALKVTTKKQCWKQIIKHKIINQSHNLELRYSNTHLLSFLSKVKAGDKDNIESIVASYYFKVMFGKSFYRRNDLDKRNTSLNYGYTIIRSFIIRTIIAYGMNPSFGMWHSNTFNAYNLADDFIEPYRPIVDLYVLDNISETTPLTSSIKKNLISLLDTKVLNTEGKKVSMSDSIKEMVASYQSVFYGKRNNLKIPTMIK